MMKKPFSKKLDTKVVSQKNLNRRNFIAFTSFVGLNVLAFGGWRWLYKSPAENAGVTAGARKPLRRALNQSELILKNIQ